MSHPNDEHRQETKAEADSAREYMLARIMNQVFGGIGFLANKPARWLLTLMVAVAFAMGGYSMFWLNNQNIAGRAETNELRKQMAEMQQKHFSEITELRKEYYKFVLEDHNRMIVVVEQNTKTIQETSRVMFRFEQALDKLKL